MSRHALADAVSFYDGLLRGEVLQRTHETLLRQCEERRALYKGRPLYRALRPRFITPEQHADFQQASAAVSRALDTVYLRAREDESFRRELGVQEWEEFLMPVDAGTRMSRVSGRLDGFVGPDGVLRFIEYNTDPGGLIYMQDLGEAFAATPALEAFSRRYEFSVPPIATPLIETLKAQHAIRNRSGVPQLAFFGPPTPEDSEEEELYRDFIQAHGLPIRIVTSEDAWTHRDGQLYVEDFRVDVVTFIGGAGFAGLIVGCNSEHPVMQALTEGSAYFMNGLFRNCVMRSKALFAALSDPAQSEMFAPDVRPALARHIPWTRIVREGKTRYDGREVDLLSFIAEHRERLVLKPANEFGGTGVTLGWQTDAGTWSTALKTALEAPWIVQERVPTPMESYPIYDGGQIRYEELYADLNPFVWNGDRQAGLLTRLSRDAIVNVAQGGCMTPVVVVRP
ncbi:hypothetical protein [Archangium lansingense]|uniref:Circularly permuted ATP-grasp superfamily protein n=1 Tax=Archangium lansingense TaxID=2995310 RepID=A0ABT4A9P9_9BACT|nr:hypothetical protein [Archangium lansinium]MCY1078387.1 hypothetical protein [Archangium lansinium]